jgi:nitrate reductase delta subunit
MKRQVAATLFGCASVLLSYPDEGFVDDLDALRVALGRLPLSTPHSMLEAAARWLLAMPSLEAAQTYVDTFDLRKGVCLHLTYYRYGDTRERGMALAALAGALRRAGFEVVPGELPDYLPALLELAAAHPLGADLLREQRMSLDALHFALGKHASPYAGVVEAVRHLLPGPTRADRQTLQRYRAEGPPSEKVGLEPFAPPVALGDAPAWELASQ